MDIKIQNTSSFCFGIFTLSFTCLLLFMGDAKVIKSFTNVSIIYVRCQSEQELY
jgi:hypothetical protein